MGLLAWALVSCAVPARLVTESLESPRWWCMGRESPHSRTKFSKISFSACFPVYFINSRKVKPYYYVLKYMYGGCPGSKVLGGRGGGNENVVSTSPNEKLKDHTCN